MRFLGFSKHENGAPRQEISKWSTVCRTFSRSRWSVVRSASLAKGGTSKKRPSPHLHRVPTPSNNVSPRTSQTALAFCDIKVNPLKMNDIILQRGNLSGSQKKKKKELHCVFQKSPCQKHWKISDQWQY
jgi:hypothetical protein